MCSCEHQDPRERIEGYAEHQALLMRAARRFTQNVLVERGAAEARGPISAAIDGVESPWYVGDDYYADASTAEIERKRRREAAERADKRRVAALAVKHAELTRREGHDAIADFLEAMARTLHGQVAA